jgi:hypothetical protein
VLLGTIAAMLFFLGKGSRMTGQQLDSALDYWLGTLFQLSGLALLLLVFAVWHRTRLAGPKHPSRGTNLATIGWLYLAMSALITLSLVSLIVAANRPGTPVGMIAGSIVSSRDLVVRLALALLLAGVGASSIARERNAWLFVRLAAIPLGLVWPHGFALAAWTAWSSIGNNSFGSVNAAARIAQGEFVVK